MITRSIAGVIQKKTFLANTITEPATVKQALTDPNWRHAMETEFKAFQKNRTWSLVPPSSHGKVIDGRWVSKVKYKPDGSIDGYKARLVARGFNQTHGLDYFETVSPVVKSSTIRIILTIALSSQGKIRQLDIQNAFLNGDLQEQVFMHQPSGFIGEQFTSHVCYLHKALYGLKQAPQAWFTKLSNSLMKWGFICSQADNSLFVSDTQLQMFWFS